MPVTVVKHFWAKAGTITMPGADGPVTIPVWGYAPDSLPCQIPGPIIEATAGDTLEMTLHNTLGDPVSMIFPGQEVVPHPVKDSEGRFISFTDHAGPGESITYTVPLSRPGTFRYESGTHPGIQVQMGLAGALIVRPSGFDPGDPGSWSAYGPGTYSEYDREQLLILGEVDSRLHADVTAGRPFTPLNFSPDWWTINGRAFPDTLGPDNLSSQPLGVVLEAREGERVLLRCLNLGFEQHSLHFDGLRVRVVGQDGWPLATEDLDGTYERRTISLAPGGSFDAILAAGQAGEYHFYDRDLVHSLNQGQFPGGMMTRLTITA